MASAMLSYKRDGVDEAMAQFQKALEINPNYAEARFNLGVSSFSKRTGGRGNDPVSKGLGNQTKL